MTRLGMSAFTMHRREGSGAIDLIHIPTGAVYLRLYPYYDLWPISRRVTVRIAATRCLRESEMKGKGK